MANLAVLPLFHDLKGRRAVVWGATDAAGWKSDLVTAAGATVLRVTDGRPWDEGDLTGCALAVADATDDDQAARLAAAARAAGVPVNIIDRPAHCDFSFGAIVNRSPVVVGISTAGAAPVLCQAVRRRIETLLPPGIARWAQAAAGLRARMRDLMPEAARRRRFWRVQAERAFAEPDHPAPETLMDPANLTVRDAGGMGRVTLVGAGPGDAELLTLKAVRALQVADVILYDDLVSDEVLELARREAKRLLVGKRGNRPSCRQDEINGLMIKLAGQGKQVVRLKSGDPMIFGRAGEEIADLRAHGIAVDVVPGITAALGAAAALGVSLTHRDHARSVRFVTGHGHAGGLPDDLDWRGLADVGTTLMVYMAGRTAGTLARRLIEMGRAPGTPTVLICNVSRRGETREVRTLGYLAGQAPEAGEGPVLIGIGEVFADLRAAAVVPQTSDPALAVSDVPTVIKA
ncbi:MAG: uroporphyrinogen-III C-methyltransferase [Rhodospirillales bacterium CG15_BIG_FIL_POST_REV_8_21_14_020_66_15]|nr:MAG: uroporphyrinogen-III C-methyltransferase [Rhodospirillales bacterium CG15_BIG_FIL_POST_REV_8_21_14_020_66_15]